ncbi:hypothetical protein FH608_018585 [Nonomuraea phyllanthi]|uniref:Uncharacterized protein n=1 Tax=Nonomuraea phyllanthi TaxID=2219224 RepID=A0A5C4WIT4_9ACTN|nr:aroma-sacti cluster domain-containing protein [Nonomuraea phyllanthi]KAB8194179.1 hypothetical protein FH608_018585 [Nonomuraea phyllanthi]QFY07779.1 hypothetical protein GBF35_14750 [Nonomuraea phyllanthi]
MAFDALSALRAGGHWVDLLTAEQKEVMKELTEEEVTVLNRIKSRLDAVAPDVQGQDVKVL